MHTSLTDVLCTVTICDLNCPAILKLILNDRSSLSQIDDLVNFLYTNGPFDSVPVLDLN